MLLIQWRDPKDFMITINSGFLYPPNASIMLEDRRPARGYNGEFLNSSEPRSADHTYMEFMTTTHESMEHERLSFPRHRPHISQS
jgi:hypothetical protein